MRKARQRQAARARERRVVVVWGLPLDATEEELFELCSPFGACNPAVARDPLTGASCGTCRFCSDLSRSSSAAHEYSLPCISTYLL